VFDDDDEVDIAVAASSASRSAPQEDVTVIYGGDVEFELERRFTPPRS